MSIHPAGATAGEQRGIAYSGEMLSWTAALVSVFAFGIYLRTLQPATGFWDTAEAQTVPHTLSIFHPTGFPTYTLVGWLWSQIPFGSVAWRMNLLSAVCVALAAGLVVLIAGHVITERHRLTAALAAGLGGLSFAVASEPWKNALRADVHALHILIAALIIWLLFVWRAAERSGARRAGRWLAAAALIFGIGMGNHPLTGLLAFGIAAFVVIVDPGIWRRWKLLAACAGMLALGLATYLYIPIRALMPPEPPLFYARPTTLERMRYLIFAEQFKGLFDNFASPFDFFGDKWRKAEDLLAKQWGFLPWTGPFAWMLAAIGAATVAVRQVGAFVFLGLVAAANVYYSLNFQDGDIDRYYMTTVLVGCVLIATAVAMLSAGLGHAGALVSRGRAARRGRRRLARGAGAAVLVLGAVLPVVSVSTLYAFRDRSSYRDADRWVASVYAAVPPNSVIISWWSYSTPLWYHRWILGERPDVTIIDERNILDDGYGTIDGAVRAFAGKRPLFIVPPDWERQQITNLYHTIDVPTYAGYTTLLKIEAPP